MLTSDDSVGLLGGVAISTFSKTLAFLLGLVVFGVQVLRLPPFLLKYDS